MRMGDWSQDIGTWSRERWCITVEMDVREGRSRGFAVKGLETEKSMSLVRKLGSVTKCRMDLCLCGQSLPVKVLPAASEKIVGLLISQQLLTTTTINAHLDFREKLRLWVADATWDSAERLRTFRLQLRHCN